MKNDKLSPPKVKQYIRITTQHLINLFVKTKASAFAPKDFVEESFRPLAQNDFQDLCPLLAGVDVSLKSSMPYLPGRISRQAMLAAKRPSARLCYSSAPSFLDDYGDGEMEK